VCVCVRRAIVFVWYRLVIFGLLLLFCACFCRIRQRGMLKTKRRAVLDVPKSSLFLSIEMGRGGFRVARRLAGCAC